MADTKKRGRPRKPTKSPKGGHRTTEETSKNSKPRSRTRGVGSPMKKKTPISKATIATSDDGSDDRSQGASSDSDADRPTRVSPAVAAMNEKRRSNLSCSSSEDESSANGKNSASEDETKTWRRVSIKRSKLAESPKKQEKKKSPTKAKSRRSSSRVTNVGGSDSDSESELSVRNSRIQVAR